MIWTRAHNNIYVANMFLVTEYTSNNDLRLNYIAVTIIQGDACVVDNG